jgi:hypothetical protein
MSGVAVHEASHAAAALALGRKVEHIEREIGYVAPGEQGGRARIPIGDRIEASQIPICLAGYASTGRADWPPSYEEARTEDLEGLGLAMKALRVGPQDYAELVRLTRDVLADPHVRELRDALARALDAVPTIYTSEINEIAEAVGFPIPEAEEPILCNTSS